MSNDTGADSGIMPAMTKPDDEKTVTAKRLDEIKADHGCRSIRDLRARFGLTTGADKWGERDSIPRAEGKKLADQAGYNLEWVLYGKGEKWKGGERPAIPLERPIVNERPEDVVEMVEEAAEAVLRPLQERGVLNFDHLTVAKSIAGMFSMIAHAPKDKA